MIERHVSDVLASNARTRTMALVGAGAALLISLIHSGSVTEREFGPTIWIVVALVVALLVAFRPGRRLLWERPELLVPIGFVLPLHALIGWVSSIKKLESLMQPIATLSLWGGGFVLSLPSLCTAATWTAYAAWQTDLLIRALERPSLELDLSPSEPIRRGFWRAFGALFMGVLGLQLVTIPVLKFYEHDLTDQRSFSGFAFFLCLGSLLWSIATLWLLPRILAGSDPFWTAAKDGIRIGLRNWGHGFAWVMIHMALLGSLTYYSSSHGGGFDYSENAHGLWVGGYPNPTNWYSDYQSWQKQPQSPFVETILSALYLILAVAVKVPVIRYLLGKPGALPAELAPDVGEAEPVAMVGNA